MEKTLQELTAEKAELDAKLQQSLMAGRGMLKRIEAIRARMEQVENSIASMEKEPDGS